MPESAPLSVTELAAVLKGHVAAMGFFEVAGEVTGHRHYAASGHHYFSIKDESATVACVLYSYQARWLKMALDDGMRVVIRGKADFYGKTGKLSVIVDTLRPEGEGDLHRRFKELQARLAAEGLFDEARKRPLPELPRVVAFVTSAQGAVWHDFTEVLRTRGWSGHAWLVPAKVQGDTCPGSVAEGVARANGIPGIDLVVVGRGGGSMEDLWGFNDEKVVRAVAASAAPVISAVGHQTDFTLCDFAADVRAETPTAAAELIASGQARLRERVRLLAAELARHSPQARVRELFQRLDLLAERLAGEAEEALAERRHRLAELAGELHRLSPSARLQVARERLGQLQKRLRAAGFESTLARGYAIVRDADGKVVSRAKDVRKGKALRLRFKDGEADAAGA
ncbi:MAG: exodeoxyribonuclease VII large subunit [Opitutales bacterium]